MVSVWNQSTTRAIRKHRNHLLSYRSRGALMSYTDHSVQRRLKSNAPNVKCLNSAKNTSRTSCVQRDSQKDFQSVHHHYLPWIYCSNTHCTMVLWQKMWDIFPTFSRHSKLLRCPCNVTSSTVKILGVILDSNLSFESHISHVTKTAFLETLPSYGTCKLFLMQKSSRLDYCNGLLGGCPASSINKLQIVVLCSIHRYDDVLSQRFDDTSIQLALYLFCGTCAAVDRT